MNEWVNGDPEKPWEFLRFVADALEQGREVEHEWFCVSHEHWKLDCAGSAIASLLAKGHKVRARIKSRPLAPWWKELTPDTELPDQYALTSSGSTDPTIVFSSSWGESAFCAESFLANGWTHYARKEDILHGCKGEGE